MKTAVIDQRAQRTCQDLLALVNMCKVHLHQIAEEHKLTPMQLFALRAIYEGNNATGKIAETLHCDASNVTGIVDRLVTLKFVTRQEDALDRRVKTVQLTTVGEAVLQHALESLPDKIGCGTLTKQESDNLHAVISKLV